MANNGAKLSFGYIYLIQEREFIRLNENVFKVGRTFCVKTRLNQYPKGSQLLAYHCVPNQYLYETELLNAMAHNFVKRRDYGHEYFEGDKAKIIAFIQDQLQKLNNIHGVNDNNTCNTTDVIMEYIASLNIPSVPTRFPSKQLYDGYIEFITNLKAHIAYLPHAQFSYALRSLCNTQRVVARDPDTHSPTQMIIFNKQKLQAPVQSKRELAQHMKNARYANNMAVECACNPEFMSSKQKEMCDFVKKNITCYWVEIFIRHKTYDYHGSP